MTEHLLLTPHLTPGPADELVTKTYLGQAHFAGTGPEGATCRQCIWWKLLRMKKAKKGREDAPPEFYEPGHHKKDGELRRKKCTRPIHGKAKRLVPHHAEACRLFEPNPNPPAIRIEPESN